MTTRAAFSLYRHVFIDEWPLFVGMAFEAKLVSIGKSPDLAQGGCAVSIVAVAALNQSFVDAVVIGLTEVSLGRCMAAVAESRLCLNQQVFRFLGVMRRVAVQTTDGVAGVCRAREMPLFVLFAVATEATSAGFLRGKLLKANNLGDIATAFYMFRSRAVAGFASVPILKGSLEVRRGLEVLFVEIFVARLAGIRPGVLSSPAWGWCDILLLPSSNSGLHQRQQQKCWCTQ
jgi:hypothetical protein